MKIAALHLSRLAAAAVWALAWAAMALLDGHVDLASLALLLVLASALAALWLPLLAALPTCAAAVLAFNWWFVPPRGAFAVDLHQHALLLLTMAIVSGLVSLLVTRQRQQAARAAGHARRANELRAMGEALRDADDPLQRAAHLQHSLAALASASVTLLLLKDTLPRADDAAAALLLGPADSDQHAGLWLSLRESRAFGPGTGRHEQQGAWYLPMHGRSGSLGAALLTPSTLSTAWHDAQEAAALRAHAQALCDQMGLALERAQTHRAAARAREDAQAHKLRNTLLAAISHDYRTPLATIVGAASALQEQAPKLSLEQRQRLAASIVAEADQLGRLTDNTLQLARLDAKGLALRLDWESAEELVGAVLRRLRPRDPAHRVRARLEPGLPLLRCDAVLLLQMLDNLLDNALKHGGSSRPQERLPAFFPHGEQASLGRPGAVRQGQPQERLPAFVPQGDESRLGQTAVAQETPVEIVVRRIDGEIVIAVRDRGPGVPPAWRERVFEVFQRGQSTPGRGVGVGLAVCRAIARAHGGDLVYRPRGHGGASFECRLPLVEPPVVRELAA